MIRANSAEVMISSVGSSRIIMASLNAHLVLDLLDAALGPLRPIETLLTMQVIHPIHNLPDLSPRLDCTGYLGGLIRW